MKRYQEWISSHSLLLCRDSNCKQASEEMVAIFPELEVVRGHVVYWGGLEKKEKRAPHWWCVTPDGEVVDPTSRQFFHLMGYARFRYEPHDESRGEPVGKCIECGEYVWGRGFGGVFCSGECQKSAQTWIHGEDR